MTGAGSGIGLATATRFLQAGWNVSFNVFDENNERAAHERIVELSQEDPGALQRSMVVRADVADDGQCRSMVASSLQRFARMDALVNAAGITRFCDEADLEGIDAADFHAIYAVNTIGTFQMARAASHALRAATQSAGDVEGPTSAIVNLSSYAGIHGGGSSLAYGASKAALENLALSYAEEVQNLSRVKVAIVDPGKTRTKMRAKAYPGEDPATLKEPAVVGEAVAKLLANDFETGNRLVIS